MAKTWDEIVAERKKQQASAKTWDDIVRERGGTTKKAESATQSKLGQVFDRPGSGVSTSKAAPKKTMAEQMAYAGSRDRELRTAEIVKSKTSAPTDSTQKTASVPYMPGYTQFKQAQTVFRNAKAQAAQEAERQTVYNAAAREIAARRTAGGTDALLASPENRQSLRAATPATRKTVVLPDTMAERLERQRALATTGQELAAKEKAQDMSSYLSSPDNRQRLRTATPAATPAALPADLPKYASGMPAQEAPKISKAGYLGKSAVAGLMDTAAELEIGAQLPQRLSDRRAKTYLQQSGADYDTLKAQEILSDKNTAVEDARDSMSQKLAEEGQALGAGWQTAGALTRGTTHMLPTMALGLAGGGTLGTAAMSTLAGVGSAQQALDRGATAGQALAYGVGSGLLSYGTERMFGGIPGLGKGGVDGLIERVLEKSGIGKAAAFAVKRGADVIGEGLEEVAENAVQPTLQRATYDPSAKDATAEEQLSSFLMGSALSMILGGPADVKSALSLARNTDGMNISKIGAEILQAGRQDAVIAAGLAAPEGSAARTMAEALQAQRNAGRDVSAADLGGLVLENIREVAGKATAEAETGALTNIPAGAVDAHAGNMVEYQKAGGEVYGSEGQTRNTGVGEAQADAGAAGEGGLDHAQFQDHPETVPVGERNNPQHGRGGIYGTADGGLVRGNGPLLVRPEITEQFKAHNIDTYPMQGGVEGAAFSDAIKAAKAANPHGAYVTAYDAEHYAGNRNFLGDNGNAGVSVTPDGDIISVFKSPNSKTRKAVTQLLLTALENGGVKLDNFDGELSKFYMRHGFVPVARTAFNPEFAPPDWNYERDGHPDIVFWAHNGDTSTEVLDNYGGYNYRVQDAPIFEDYDSAAAHRDSVIGQVRQERQAEKQNTQAAGSSPAASSLENAPNSAADEEIRLRRELDRMAAGQTAPSEQGANPTGSANASGANPQGPLAAAAERARTQTVDRDQAKRAIRATPGKRHEKISSFTVDWFEALGREIGVKMQWFDDASPDALDGLYDNGTIYINLQAQKPADAVFRHELTHYLEETNPEGYSRLLGLLQETDPDALETVRANLRVKYAESGELIGDEQLDRELVANMAETVLTDDQTARAIAQSDPNLAGTILSWIRRMLRAITNVGHKQASLAPELLEKYSPAGTFSRDGLNRARVIYEDVVRTTKPAPEKAGRANTRTVGAQASIRTADNGEKYTVIDTGQDVFKDAPVSAYPAIARRVIRAKFVGETLPVSENDLADVTNKSAGEYAYPHNVPAYTENRAKMKASTELDNLLAASTYSHSAPDDRRHSIASRGWDYYNTTFVVDGKTFRGLVNIAKSPNGKTFYDITKIQEAPDMSGREAAAPAAPKSTPAFRDPYANSIPTSDGNDNTHFLQNNDNAAGQDGQSGGPQASIRLGDITQTPEEKIERNKDDPHNSEEYRAYASDTTFPTAEGETAFARPDVAGAVKLGSVFADHVGISKDLTRNLNTVFAASPTARELARQELERPLWQAKGDYAKDVQAARQELYDNVVKKLGIRAHSPESAAIMWYGEGVRQISAPGKRPDGKKFELEAYTLDDLKREFDYTAKNGKKAWENVVEAERYFRTVYDSYVKRINQSLEEIYPDVKERAQADYEAKRAAADSHLQRAERFERDARQTLHEIETRAGNARQELTEKHDVAMRYADEIEAGGARERDDLLRQADDARAEAGRLRADAAKKRRRDTKAYADLIRKAERSETQAGRFEAQAKSAQATEDAQAAKIRNSAVLLLERAELFRQDAQKAGQSGAYRRAMAAAERARTQYQRNLSEAQDIARSIEDGSILRNKRLTPREDYFHHFMEMQRGMGSLSDILNASTDIDPQLVGKSEFTQPNSKWTGFMQRRRGGRYMEDAVGGLLSYIPQAEYKINIEPLIPHFRACVRDLADATGETRNANQLISFLIDFTNDIAGKTNPIDRTVLRWFGDQNGRQLLNVLGRISKRPRVNAVAGNIGTVIAQFSNIPNIAAYVNNPATMALGTYDAVRALAGDPEARAALDQSIFLRERYLDQSERKFSVGAGEHLEDVLSLLMEAGDQASTTAGWFALYRQKLKRGGTAEQAVEYADEYIRLAVGGRGIGEVPLAQKARLTKALAPFQVEVNNTWRLLTDIVHGRDALAFLKMAVAGWLLNRLYEKLMGRSIVFDPIDATADAVQTLMNPDNGSIGKRALMAGGRLGGEVLNAVPFGGYVASGVIQDEETRKTLFGDRDPTRFGLGNIGVNTIVQPIADLAQGRDIDLLKPAMMYAVPYGGRQIEKAVRGLQDLSVLPREHINADKHTFSFDRYAFPSSRTDSGNIRFAIDAANPFEVLAAVLLGTSATQAAQAYYGGDGKPLSAGDTLRTDTAVTAFGITPEDYMQYNREIKDVQGTKNAKGNTVSGSVQANKMKYAGGLPLSAGQKAAVYELSNKRTPPDEDVRALSRETGLTLGTVRAARGAYMRILPGYRGGKTDADSLKRQFADYLKKQDMTNAQRLAVYNFFLGIKEE